MPWRILGVRHGVRPPPPSTRSFRG